VRTLHAGWAIALAASCRLGGPSADPLAQVAFPTDAAADSSEDAPSSTDAGADDGAAPGEQDAIATADALPDTGPVIPASDGGVDAACVAPSTVPVCNPVTNAGCGLLAQCDIDTTRTTPTGACVFGSPFPNDAGSPCTQASGSVSCQPQYTCYGATCRKVCFCDPDCGSGQCCSGTAGATGFGLCGACR
jgi:hypothetical protein